MVPTSATLFNYNKTAPEIKLPWAITKFHQNLKKSHPKANPSQTKDNPKPNHKAKCGFGCYTHTITNCG
jgi:hypothetical protein